MSAPTGHQSPERTAEVYGHLAHPADYDAPEREHAEGCLTEHTWHEPDCTCRVTCPRCATAPGFAHHPADCPISPVKGAE